MQKRLLGHEGLQVSSVGLGCWSFGSAYGPTTEAESHDTLDAAIDHGITFLDTANVYGNGVSEQVIGSFLAKTSHKFTIATKGGIHRPPGSTERTFDNSPKHLRTALEKSLTNLGVEYVDLYYIHRREAARPIEDVMETLVRFKKEGKIGGIGFSEIAPASLRRAHAIHPVTAIQSEYSLWTRQPELGMIQACKELGVAFVPFSPLGRGIFGSVTPDPTTFGKLDFRLANPRFTSPNFETNVKQIAAFKAYAADNGFQPASLAIAWTLHKGEHLIPIPGTRSRDHLEEHAKAAQITLSANDMAEIDLILPAGFAHGYRYSEKQAVGAELY
ncbi:MAG: aldo/keto reductase [Sneathiella sp.]